MIRFIRVAVATLLSIGGVALGSAHAQSSLDDADALIAAELARFEAPGISVAVIKGDQVLLLEGFGLRDLEKRLPMTADTVQPIASVTKSFTVAALATLVRDGKLEWDKPVRDYLPDFRLSTDQLTTQVTVRDLVTHRTGLPRHDAAWFGSAATREQFYKRLRHFEPSAPLRERMQYNNFMYMTAGFLGGRVATSDWETLVQRNLFDPLGMEGSSFTIAKLSQRPDHGTAYTPGDDGKPKLTRYTPIDAMGPTGAINASARDMSRYLLMLANSGMHTGKTLISAADLAQMTSPQMVLPDARRWTEFGPRQYGMGFFIGNYRGHRFFEHGGNMPGAAAQLLVLPDHKIGVFVCANLSGTALRDALPWMLVDRLLELEPIAWGERMRADEVAGRAAEQEARAKRVDPRKNGTRPAHPIADYAGIYEHPGYGRLEVTLSGDRKLPLVFNYNSNVSKMEHFHFEVFKIPDDKLNEWEGTKLNFITGLDGEIEAVESPLQPLLAPIRFRRLPDARLSDPTFIAAFAGKYAIGGFKFEVLQRSDGVLSVVFPGQPAFVLDGVRGTRFAVRGRDGISLEFLRAKDGSVPEVAILSANGNQIAKRVE
jgi:CubicO group peptidase (beta-lactamase class C family)